MSKKSPDLAGVHHYMHLSAGNAPKLYVHKVLRDRPMPMQMQFRTKVLFPTGLLSAAVADFAGLPKFSSSFILHHI